MPSIGGALDAAAKLCEVVELRVAAAPASSSAEPVPWSVPPVPFIATVRPNSVPTATSVRRQAGPSAVRSAASPASSWARGDGHEKCRSGRPSPATTLPMAP